MRGMVIVAVAALAGTVAAQSFAETKSNYDKDFQFGTLKTFDFKHQARPARDPEGPNPMWKNQIETQLEKDLTANGFERKSGGEPDFLVAFYMGTHQAQDVRFIGYGFPRWGWHRWGWAGWGPEFDVWSMHRTRSTLVVDVIDARTNMLVWRGYDSDSINLDKADKTIDKATSDLVRRFVKDTRDK